MPKRRKVQKGRTYPYGAGWTKVELPPEVYAKVNDPKPAIFNPDARGKVNFIERRKRDRREGQAVKIIGKIKGKDAIGMTEAEFASLKEPKPERIASKKKLKELGVKKGHVAFKDRRE